MNLKQLVFLSLLRIVILILAVKITAYFIPYWGFFPFKDYVTKHNLPEHISIFGYFDGAHYLRIAQDGYYEFSQAFFPVYPILIRAISNFFSNNFLVAALALSNVSFIAGLYFAYKTALTFNKDKAWLFILFYLSFPTSFFFTAVYTEGLFFLLFYSYIYFLKKKEFGTAAIIAAFASATRFIGIFFFIPMLFSLINEKKNKLHKLVLSISPFIGFLLYACYLYFSTGNPFFFFTSQTAFGANRSTHLILLPQVYYRYLKIFLTANYDFAYLLAAFEVLVFTFCLVVILLYCRSVFKKKDWFFLSIGIFSLINIILPTLTGTFSSIARYALFSPAVFFYLANIKNTLVKRDLIIISFFIQLLLFSFFAQGYFVG